jgi:menaquinone-dependent protoporphyrinogen oxidase
MANTLIAYATRHGHTERIARRVAGVLRSRGHASELVNTDDANWFPDSPGIRAVLVCAPIIVGGYPRSVVRFVKEHRALLERVPSAFLSVGLASASRTTDGRADTLRVVEKFVKQTGWRPTRVALVAGALAYSKYNFLIRLIMRQIAARAGGDVDTSRDYEYTDWAAVDRFASEFAAEALGTPARSHWRGRVS